MNSNNIKLYSLIKGFLTRKMLFSIPSKNQTKSWRKSMPWYKTGKNNECEKYQIKIINKIINDNIYKTHMRINLFDNEFLEVKQPLKEINGLEFSENFDGFYEINNLKIYFNLKFICGTGGAQTRSLREVYHFIYSQINIINNNPNIIFINILDGDTCFKYCKYYKYLSNKYLIENKKNIYIGDLYNFEEYWDLLKVNELNII